MDANIFTKKIKDIIEICSYNFFLVQQDFKIKCTCLNQTTLQPDANCKKCLGTGYKVKIKICRGASDDELKGGATLSARSSRIIKKYYIDNKYNISENNLIIDDYNIYYVYRAQNMRGVYEQYTHKEITATLRTENHDKILNNFLNVINKKLTPKQKEAFSWLKE